LLRGLAGLDIVAIDINTVSPQHDVSGMTAHLAAYVAFETLLLLEPAQLVVSRKSVPKRRITGFEKACLAAKFPCWRQKIPCSTERFPC
jgi:hypothetical protein